MIIIEREALEIALNVRHEVKTTTVWLYLVEKAYDTESATINVTVREMERELEKAIKMSRTTIKRRLQQLEEMGYLNMISTQKGYTIFLHI